MLTLLKTIPDTLTVKECKESDDPRLKFILAKYIQLRKTNKEMAVLSDDMTIGVLKDNLNKVKPELLFSFIDEYRDTFILNKGKEDESPEKAKRKVFWIIFYYTLTVFTILLGASLVYGIMSGTLTVNEIISTVVSKITDMINIFIPNDTAL